jgi:beta-glucosidase
LSYTTFSYANLRVAKPRLAMRDSVDVSVDVTNTGARAGDEVVQLYVRDDVASVAQPVRQLKGFRRINLQPRQTTTVTFRLRPDDFGLYDQQMRRVVEPGFFTVYAGGSSAATLSNRFEVVGPTLILAPSTPRFH